MMSKQTGGQDSLGSNPAAGAVLMTTGGALSKAKANFKAEAAGSKQSRNRPESSGMMMVSQSMNNHHSSAMEGKSNGYGATNATTAASVGGLSLQQRPPLLVT